ncbi:MAG: hypothetical protein WCW36_02470 [Candidatus Paceibacterota bacterium]
MKDKINTYLAVLLITIAGSGAAMLIVHIAYSDTSSFALGSEAEFAQLQQSILKQ